MNALSRTFPGQRIYVPWRDPVAIARFRTNFTPMIGSAAVTAMLDNFGCERISVPSREPSSLLRGPSLDVAKVAALTRQGLVALQIARKLNCNPRSVHKARTTARRMGLLPPRASARKSHD